MRIGVGEREGATQEFRASIDNNKLGMGKGINFLTFANS